MPEALVAADLDFALDVLVDLASQVTFDAVVAADPFPDTDDLVVGQVAGASGGTYS
jgi:hypothetical protein